MSQASSPRVRPTTAMSVLQTARARSPAALEPAVPAAGASPSRGPCWPPRAHDPSPRARARSSVAPVCAQPRGLAPPRRKHADVGAAPPTPPARHGRVGVPPRRQALPYRRRRPGMGAWGRRPVATTALARAGADPTQLGAGRWPPLPSHGSSPDGAPDPCAAPSGNVSGWLCIRVRVSLSLLYPAKTDLSCPS
jgi:hypothetical protein